MSGNDSVDLICVGVGAISTALQTSEVFSYISLGVTILAGIVSLIYRIWKWYKEAKKDGKITSDEVSNLVDTVATGVDEIKTDVDNVKKKDETDGK